MAAGPPELSCLIDPVCLSCRRVVPKHPVDHRLNSFESRSASRIVMVIVALDWPIAAPRIPTDGGATMRHFYSGETRHYYSAATCGNNTMCIMLNSICRCGCRLFDGLYLQTLVRAFVPA